MKNKEICEAAEQSGVRLYELAYSLELQDTSLSRPLRRELPPRKADRNTRCNRIVYMQEAEMSEYAG